MGREIGNRVRNLAHSFQPGSQTLPKTTAQYTEDDRKMKEWIITATSITVWCRFYCFSVLSVCIFIIVGALAIPFAVQNRIKGVDPFQLTMFVWLVVGVILVAAKGRYVKEWPWHDFYHGRVVCDSIADLADVTGMDKQTILAKLLSNEMNTTLITKGPYNGMFKRKSESSSEGFSIDEPVKLSTMLASGFIILKVISNNGEHLICLDARKKTKVDWAHKKANSMSYLCCLDMPSNDGDEWSFQKENKPSTKGPKHVFYLREAAIGWHRLIGLYTADAVFG
jgi:hypothetical protein